MVSTSTLAAGMNLPAQNVFLSADRWRYDDRLGLPWKTPILRAEYENMSGRAGRYGAVKDFGRSVLIATTPFDQETLWRRYVEGERERITPQLSRGPLEDHVLRLVASRFCRTEEELVVMLEATLTGVWIWREMYTVDEVACRVRSAVHRALDAGMLATSLDERLEATPLGRAVAAKGITIATARQLEHWIGESETRHWTDVDLLFAAAVSPDGRNVQVLLSTREYERANYPALLKALTRDEELVADTPINRIRNCTLQPFFEEVRAIKTVLFLHEWLEHAAVCDLEERYNTMAGQILAAADQTAWILDTTAAVAVALGAPAQFVDRIRMLAERTARGLHEGLLPLAHAHIPGLDRNLCIRLEREGLVTAAALRQCTPAELGQWMDAGVSTPLLAWARSQEELRPALAVSPPIADPAPRPVLIVDDNMPGEIHIDGARVALQDKQYRLVRLLAANPNVCVPYETIYQELWGEMVVEDNQIHFQKRKLIKAISGAAPHRAGIIQTITKRGFRLKLESQWVLVKVVCVVDAA
jgi:helicase